MRQADRFVVLTYTWKRWVEATESRAQAIVIPNPVPEFPELDDAQALSVQAVTAGDPGRTSVLLFLGRIEGEKGIFVLLEALAEAKLRGASWQLVCGGEGDIEPARRHAAALGLLDTDVRFLGWVDGEAKRGWLRRCDMLVLPSLNENMPVVVLEAFAYGKPVAASSVGGIPDMVLDGQDGFLFPPGDSNALMHILLHALQPDVNLRHMGVLAREKAARHYAAPDIMRQVEAMYRRLLSAE
jgi:glycosyltransferase involved in cell wall biosynthesis